MSKKANPQPLPPPHGALALLGLALAESALSVFQWLELVRVRDGGSAVCAVSETLNCETVWNSPFASSVHAAFGMPVAALGLVWGLSGVALAALYLAWRRARRAVRPAVNGLRLLAAVGVLASLVFAGASVGAGALCLTCLGTYALALAFALVAWKGLPGALVPQEGEWGRAVGWTGGVALAVFVALLLPGRATPQASSVRLADVQEASGPRLPATLEQYLATLAPREQQAVADALLAYKGATAKPAPGAARFLLGKADAPVRLTEWTDSRCGHCKSFVEAFTAMEKSLPEGRVAVEPRHFPLDVECNPGVGGSDGTGVRCLAAKSLICLEGTPDYLKARAAIFARQRDLSPELVRDIATGGSLKPAQLDACLAAPETGAKLREDIQYATSHDIHGTPMVVVNGRQATAYPPFLYALALAGGDVDAPGFRALPPGREPQAHNH